jgi:hypothetical protein
MHIAEAYEGRAPQILRTIGAITNLLLPPTLGLTAPTLVTLSWTRQGVLNGARQLDLMRIVHDRSCQVTSRRG